jgi:Mn-dependent DtxR family transcriptional regulator
MPVSRFREGRSEKLVRNRNTGGARRRPPPRRLACHRLVVDLLRALGVPTEAAEADAEGIEHYVSETTLKAFAQFLKGRT